MCSHPYPQCVVTVRRDLGGTPQPLMPAHENILLTFYHWGIVKSLTRNTKALYFSRKKSILAFFFSNSYPQQMKHKIALQKQTQMVFVFNFIYTFQVIPYKYHQVKHNWF